MTGPGSQVTRRALLAGAGVGTAVGLGTLTAVSRTQSEPSARALPSYPFRGQHQAGIITPAQDHLHFAAFDVLTDDRAELISLLQDWTLAAEQLTRGENVRVGRGFGSYDSPPEDTGEAMGLPPAGLTITVGFGPSLFSDAEGRDRFGLADRRPPALERLPHFPADDLDPQRSDGDLCVQACADDPQVAVHAVRNLARIAFGRAALRWSQLGFGRTSSTSVSQQTPRNLFGFKDGTANLKAEQTDELAEHVWVAAGDTGRAGARDQWLAGGTYLVARRIAMAIEPWDRTSLREQEALVGRDKAAGAPLSGGQEFTEADLDLAGSDGEPLIAMNAHLRLAHPSTNNGVRLLRRGYNYTDGTTSLARLDAGLFFLAFVRDPRTHYIPMQRRMSREDGLMEYLVHTGSGLWAVPPGVGPGEYLGQRLFS